MLFWPGFVAGDKTRKDPSVRSMLKAAREGFLPLIEVIPIAGAIPGKVPGMVPRQALLVGPGTIPDGFPDLFLRFGRYRVDPVHILFMGGDLCHQLGLCRCFSPERAVPPDIPADIRQRRSHPAMTLFPPDIYAFVQKAKSEKICSGESIQHQMLWGLQRTFMGGRGFVKTRQREGRRLAGLRSLLLPGVLANLTDPAARAPRLQ